MKPMFKVGDLVIPNDSRSRRILGNSDIRTVTMVIPDYGGPYIRVSGSPNSFFEYRFKYAGITYDPNQQGDTDDDL